MRKCGLIAVACIATHASAQEPTTLPGGWELSAEQDAMTDEPRARVVKSSESGSLIIKCDKAGAESLYIQAIANEPLGRQFPAARRPWVRFDKQGSNEIQMATENRSAFTFLWGSTVEFLAGALKAKSVALRIWDYQGVAHDLSFDLVGIEEAVRAVSGACQSPIAEVFYQKPA